MLHCYCPQSLKVDGSICLEWNLFKCEDQIWNHAGLRLELQLLLELTCGDGIRRNESDQSLSLTETCSGLDTGMLAQ